VDELDLAMMGQLFEEFPNSRSEDVRFVEDPKELRDRFLLSLKSITGTSSKLLLLRWRRTLIGGGERLPGMIDQRRRTLSLLSAGAGMMAQSLNER